MTGLSAAISLGYRSEDKKVLYYEGICIEQQ